MLVLIGRSWSEAKNGAGQRRLEDEADFVRLEVSEALKRNIPVTPVLVQGAKMPDPELLPDVLKNLAYRNGFELSHARWDSDVREMLRRLGLETASPPSAEPHQKSSAAGSAPTEDVPAPNDRAVGVMLHRRRWSPVVVPALGLLLALGGGALYLGDQNSHTAKPSPPAPLERPSSGDVASQPTNATAEFKIYLHTKRPQTDIDKVVSALKAAGYSMGFAVDPSQDPYGNAVDYSTKDSSKDFKPEAQMIADIVNKAVGSDLKPRPQSRTPPGSFGVWF
jgi:hypothetical protein